MSWRITRSVLLSLALTVATAVAAGDPALAAPTPGTAWSLSLVAEPTNLPLTNRFTGESKDQYSIVLSNTGGVASTSPVTLADSLPTGMTVGGNPHGEGWECSSALGESVVSCVYNETIPALGQAAVLTIPVAVATAGTLTNHVSVTGGGGPDAHASRTTEVGGSLPPYGVLNFSSQLSDVSGASDSGAGDHPYALRTIVDFPQTEKNHDGRPERPLQSTRAIKIDLPAGLVGNPQALARCRITDVFARRCPLAARVGTVLLNYSQGLFSGDRAFPIYNVIPEHGYPAEFGIFITEVGTAAFMYASVGPAPDYRLHVSVPSIPAAANFANALVTFFGDPQGMNGNVASPITFFTNSSSCSGVPLTTRIEAESWEEPNRWVSGEYTSPNVSGCDLLQFQPSITVAPNLSLADEPTGFNVDLGIPQSQAPGLEGLATPPLKNAVVTLPQGVSVSASAADGLEACSAASIDLTSTEPGHCPLASQVGTAEAVTPLLPDPLKGHVYVAQPGCGGEGQPECTNTDATNGNLFGLYLELEGSGVVIKQHGTVSANPVTGQLTTSFKDAPPQPFSHLKLVLKDGPHAPLANPQTCGDALTTSAMTPWSTPQTPDATPSWLFTVTGCDGPQFVPSFEAMSLNAAGGAFTSFSTTFGRSDRQQNLAAIQARLPSGLLAMISHVTLCGEPQAARGDCPVESRIGTANAAAGPGPRPFWVSGPVYLTGPYKGAPFGLSIPIQAKAGPFNLGTVVTRAMLNVDPVTASAIITSDPLPQILDGVPLRVQTVNVTVDRSQFMFNPTNCEAKQVTATIASAQGSAAQVASPFAVGGCKSLPFKPSFTVSTRGRTSKAVGASLVVRVAEKPGEANIQKVGLQLPVALPARLTTLQKACTEAQFNRNPAGCPAASVIGSAKAVTPVLSVPLRGPAFLVSHGGAAFPDVEFILQGQGVRIDLDGKTQIKKGITYSRFESVPDAPISSFETVLPQGPHSALGTNIPAKAKGSLCKVRLVIPTTIVAQNGAQVKQNTKVSVTGCPKAHKARKARVRKHKSTKKVHKAGIG